VLPPETLSRHPAAGGLKRLTCWGGGMPSFSSTRSLMRLTVSVGSMSNSISLPAKRRSPLGHRRKTCRSRAQGSRPETKSEEADGRQREPPTPWPRTGRPTATTDAPRLRVPHISCISPARFPRPKSSPRTTRCTTCPCGARLVRRGERRAGATQGAPACLHLHKRAGRLTAATGAPEGPIAAQRMRWASLSADCR